MFGVNMDFFILMRARWADKKILGREYWSREKIQRLQNKHLESLRRYSYRYSPYYRALHKGYEKAPLSELPVVSKQELMKNYDDVVTDRRVKLEQIYQHIRNQYFHKLFLNKYRVLVTSGSTGSPAVFIFDPWMWAYVLATDFRISRFSEALGWVNKPYRSVSIASGSQWHQSWQMDYCEKDNSGNSLYLSAQDPLPALIKRLNDFKPRVLIAYTNVLTQLSRDAIEKRLNISPEVIYCGGEVLSEVMRKEISLAFGVNPYNLYGLTEAGTVASDCLLRCGMHISEDLVILENVDERNQPVGAGQFGSKILLTVLFSKTIPLIRYEVSDSMMLSDEHCSCGRTFRMIKAIKDRDVNILQIARDDGFLIPLHPNFFHAIFDLERIAAWQILKDGDMLLVNIIPLSSFDTVALQAKILQSLKILNINSIKLKINKVTELPRENNGKIRLISEMKQQ